MATIRPPFSMIPGPKALTVGVKSPRAIDVVQDKYVIFGTTNTNLGVALASADVRLFDTGLDLLIARDVSDGSGNWTISVSPSAVAYAVAYKDGGTPVTGATLRTLGVSGVSVPIYLRDPTVAETPGAGSNTYSRGRVVNT